LFFSAFSFPHRTHGRDAHVTSGIARSLTFSYFLLLVLVLAASASAAPDESSPAADVAVARGLEYLARQQQPDGSFDSPEGGGPKATVTAAALVAFLASGHTPEDGRYGLVVHNAADFLAQSVNESAGDRAENVRTLDRAWVVWALALVDGVENNAPLHAAVRAALEKSAAALLRARDARHPATAGGWGTDAHGPDDLVATAWAMLALRSAQAAGVRVPSETGERVAAYVLKCYRAPVPNKPDAHGFANNNDAPTLLPTAAAVLALEMLHRGSQPEVTDSLKWLADGSAADPTRLPPAAFCMASLAAFHAGDATWAAVWKTAREQLPPRQVADGAWPAARSPDPNAPPAAYDLPGRVWPTAVNALSLSLTYRLLPGVGAARD
jgi:hypothetical protein